MKRLSDILCIVISLSLISCATKSSPQHEIEHKFSYSYKPPLTVKKSDIEECSLKADSMAKAAVNQYIFSDNVTLYVDGVEQIGIPELRRGLDTVNITFVDEIGLSDYESFIANITFSDTVSLNLTL